MANVTTVEEIWTLDVIQRVGTLVFIMIMTLVGNMTIIILLACCNRKRNNRVNIFIVNLAVGDLTVCFATMTTEILFVAFGEWVLGPFGCKFVTYIQVVTLSSTTFILLANGFDRYLAICRPLQFRSSTARARKMILVSWVLSFVIAIPQVFIFVQTVDEYDQDRTIKYGCHSRGYSAPWQRKLYFTFMTVYILIIPAAILSYCYISVAFVVWKQGNYNNDNQNDNGLRKYVANKEKISDAKLKSVKMTFCIIISFIVCWAPYFLSTLIVIYSDYRYQISRSVMAFTETIALLQSAVNPIFYGCFNTRQFKGLFTILRSHWRSKTRNGSIPYRSGTKNSPFLGTDRFRLRKLHIIQFKRIFKNVSYPKRYWGIDIEHR